LEWQISANGYGGKSNVQRDAKGEIKALWKEERTTHKQIHDSRKVLEERSTNLKQE